MIKFISDYIVSHAHVHLSKLPSVNELLTYCHANCTVAQGLIIDTILKYSIYGLMSSSTECYNSDIAHSSFVRAYILETRNQLRVCNIYGKGHEAYYVRHFLDLGLALALAPQFHLLYLIKQPSKKDTSTEKNTIMTRKTASMTVTVK